LLLDFSQLFLILIFESLATPSDPSQGFHEEKLIWVQMRTTKDIFIFEYENDSKNDLFLFQAQSFKTNIF
jgi:hypothetical protein